MPIAKTKKLVIFGVEDFAQIACEYFTHDSGYEVVGFTVDRAYITSDTLMSLPVVAFEDIESHFPPETHDIYCALVYRNMSRNRTNACERVKRKRYALASYISSRAFVWRNVKLGEHVFIFENNTVQPFVEIGDNVILWSGNHIGHHSRVGNNCFISSHVVVSGWCRIGDNCFVGVNATLANNTVLGKESWVMHGTIMGNTIPDSSMVKSAPSPVSGLNESALNMALERASERRK